MHCYQKVLTWPNIQSAQYLAALYFRKIVLNYLIYGIAGNKNPLRGDSLFNEILFASVGIREEYGAGMVNDFPIYLFWNPFIKAAIAGFHMEDWYAHPPGKNAYQTAIGITQNKHAVGILLNDNPFCFNKYLAQLLSKGITPCTQVMVRLPQLQIGEENRTSGADQGTFVG